MFDFNKHWKYTRPIHNFIILIFYNKNIKRAPSQGKKRKKEKKGHDGDKLTCKAEIKESWYGGMQGVFISAWDFSLSAERRLLWGNIRRGEIWPCVLALKCKYLWLSSPQHKAFALRLLLFYADIPEKMTLDICSDQLCSLFFYFYSNEGKPLCKVWQDTIKVPLFQRNLQMGTGWQRCIFHIKTIGCLVIFANKSFSFAANNPTCIHSHSSSHSLTKGFSLSLFPNNQWPSCHLYHLHRWSNEATWRCCFESSHIWLLSQQLLYTILVWLWQRLWLYRPFIYTHIWFKSSPMTNKSS